MAGIVYLVQDLLFVSKIREVARTVGVEVAGARDASALLQAARGAALVIVDLRRPDAEAALDLLAGDPAAAAVARVGFVDHERVDVMDRARERGCTPYAKGRFAAELPRLLEALRS